MSAVRIGSWQFTGEETIVDVPPVLGRGVRRIDSECLNTIDCLRTFSTFGQPLRWSRLSPPGRTNGTVE
jgi:hypothetical protein